MQEPKADRDAALIAAFNAAVNGELPQPSAPVAPQPEGAKTPAQDGVVRLGLASVGTRGARALRSLAIALSHLLADVVSCAIRHVEQLLPQLCATGKGSVVSYQLCATGKGSGVNLLPAQFVHLSLTSSSRDAADSAQRSGADLAALLRTALASAGEPAQASRVCSESQTQLALSVHSSPRIMACLMIIEVLTLACRQLAFSIHLASESRSNG
eukprot:1157753-Pelagomonas_calceolata.AAC.3